MDESLMRAINATAASAGLTLRDWVIGCLAEKAGWDGRSDVVGGAGREVEADGGVPRRIEVGSGETLTIAERSPALPQPSTGRIADNGAAEEVMERCPDDGGLLVWNRLLKRWECDCGWQGKRQR